MDESLPWGKLLGNHLCAGDAHILAVGQSIEKPRRQDCRYTLNSSGHLPLWQYKPAFLYVLLHISRSVCSSRINNFAAEAPQVRIGGLRSPGRPNRLVGALPNHAWLNFALQLAGRDRQDKEPLQLAG